MGRNASDAEVKRAYRQLALKWHPDKHTNKGEAEARFLEVTQAYELVMADAERQRHSHTGVDAMQTHGMAEPSEDDTVRSPQEASGEEDQGNGEDQRDAGSDSEGGSSSRDT